MLWAALLLGPLLPLHIALSLRVLPDKLNCIHFQLTLALGFLAMASASFPFYLVMLAGLISQRTLERIGFVIAGVVLRIVRFLNPQLRTFTDYSKVKWSEVTPNAHVMCNHSSFWDSLGYTAEVPLALSWTKKTLMKSSMMRTPIAGWFMFKVMGTFAVYFSSDAAAEFGVDKEKQAKVSAAIDAWIASGNSLTYCCEGKMGEQPETIQPLRYGMLKVLAKTDAPIFVCTQWNNNKFWPIGGEGGHAADVAMTLGRYRYKNGTEPMPRDPATGEVDVAKFADDLRAFMQSEVDRLREIFAKRTTKS